VIEALGGLAGRVPVRPVARRATHASPFQSARETVCEDGHRPFHVETACTTGIFLADWKGEGRSRRTRSRLSDPYPSERSERGYVAERPRAARRHAPLLRARSAATRERPEGFHRTASTAALSADGVCLVPPDHLTRSYTPTERFTTVREPSDAVRGDRSVRRRDTRAGRATPSPASGRSG